MIFCYGNMLAWSPMSTIYTYNIFIYTLAECMDTFAMYTLYNWDIKGVFKQIMYLVAYFSIYLLKWINNLLLLCSHFLLNDGGGGGTVSVAYFPLAFNGNTVFQENKGRTLVVSSLSTKNTHTQYVPNSTQSWVSTNLIGHGWNTLIAYNVVNRHLYLAKGTGIRDQSTWWYTVHREQWSRNWWRSTVPHISRTAGALFWSKYHLWQEHGSVRHIHSSSFSTKPKLLAWCYSYKYKVAI